MACDHEGARRCINGFGFVLTYLGVFNTDRVVGKPDAMSLHVLSFPLSDQATERKACVFLTGPY